LLPSRKPEHVKLVRGTQLGSQENYVPGCKHRTQGVVTPAPCAGEYAGTKLCLECHRDSTPRALDGVPLAEYTKVELRYACWQKCLEHSRRSTDSTLISRLELPGTWSGDTWMPKSKGKGKKRKQKAGQEGQATKKHKAECGHQVIPRAPRAAAVAAAAQIASSSS
jgi:hypothetical protein